MKTVFIPLLLLLVTILPTNALTEFSTTAQGTFYIFLAVIWIAFLVMTFTLEGRTGNTPQVFNIIQFVFGLVLGIQFISNFSYLLGITIWLVSLTCLVLKGWSG